MTPLAALLAVALLMVPGRTTAGDTAVERGDSGPAVAEVQTILAGFGYTVVVDSRFGPQTERAVRSWQRSNGLAVDGVVGPITLDSLRGAVASTPAVRAGNAVQVTPTVPPPKPEHYDIWLRLAQCESGGNWSINTGNGYYGGLQFALTSWRAVGGSGYPHQASAAEQMARAELLLDMQGWGAWPGCARKLGLR